MTGRLQKETIGAWIIHHGRKIALDLNAPPEFSVLDETAKAAELLMRLGQSQEATLTKPEVQAVSCAAHLNPRSELPHYLNVLQQRGLIECSANEVHVIGLTTRATLSHAHDILMDAGSSKYERAAIDLAEMASMCPQEIGYASEFVSDTFKLASKDAKDFIDRSIELGFVDVEGSANERLLFNGNLFKKDAIAKSHKVISSLSSQEQTKINEFDVMLKQNGCVLAEIADTVLGGTLFDKLKATGFYEINAVANEIGVHPFGTSPGAFHKFVDPLIDDSFDMAKALVTALA